MERRYVRFFERADSDFNAFKLEFDGKKDELVFLSDEEKNSILTSKNKDELFSVLDSMDVEKIKRMQKLFTNFEILKDFSNKFVNKHQLKIKI